MADLWEALHDWQVKVKTVEFSKRAQFFTSQLLEWFSRKGRDLPWRKTRDPFQILVSELMLQQTQVDRVLEYWPRFLKRFPNFAAVANASEEEVIAEWEGLGYYNRARNLRKLAIEVMEKFHGHFPTSREEILALPGIGEYTVGAVMTFALEKRAPLVDTNVDRVLSRVFLFPDKQIKDSERSKILWLLAETLLPIDHFWEFNQGIMDFGAIQCVPDKPLCASCPMQKICKYYSKRSLTRFF